MSIKQTSPGDDRHDRARRASRVSRRGFLAGAGGAAGAAAVTMSAGVRFAFASPEVPADGDVIVMVFLRGGADGLSLVAPWTMPTYQALRPTIRIKDASEFTDPTGKAALPLAQGGNVAPFPLSGTLAMHPGMASLYNGAWADGNLAVDPLPPGCPGPRATRGQHFEAEKNWEFGSASWSTTNGFLSRFLSAQPNMDRLAAVGSGLGPAPQPPGSGPGVLDEQHRFLQRVGVLEQHPGAQRDLRRSTTRGAPTCCCAPARTRSRRSARSRASPGPLRSTSPRTGPPTGTDDLANHLRETAMLIRGKLGLRAVAIDFGGWDTHDGMGLPEDPTSWFRDRAARLADALQAFYRDLGSLGNEVTVFTVSEFGRTIEENGSGGTDHGRGSVMFVLGQKIVGGVYGPFVPSITDGPEGDLAVLTDYRRPVSEILSVRGGASNLGAVFPTYTPQAALGLCEV